MRLQLHDAIHCPDSFVLMLRYCENLKAIRYKSMSFNRIVDDKLHLQLNNNSTFSLWYNLSKLGPSHKVYVPPYESPLLTLCPPMCKWPKENPGVRMPCNVYNNDPINLN